MWKSSPKSNVEDMYLASFSSSGTSCCGNQQFQNDANVSGVQMRGVKEDPKTSICFYYSGANSRSNTNFTSGNILLIIGLAFGILLLLVALIFSLHYYQKTKKTKGKGRGGSKKAKCRSTPKYSKLSKRSKQSSKKSSIGKKLSKKLHSTSRADQSTIVKSKSQRPKSSKLSGKSSRPSGSKKAF